MTTDYILPDDDIFFETLSIPDPSPLDAIAINGGGNGITGRIAPITIFNIATEGSNKVKVPI